MSGEQADQVETGAAAFAAAFADVTGSKAQAVVEAPAADTAEGSQNTAGQESHQQSDPAPAEKPDPFEVLRQEFNQALAQRDHQLRSAQGRIGALQRELNKAARQAQAPAPAPAEKPRMPAFERIQEELPDVAEAMTELMSANAPKPQAQQPQVSIDDQPSDLPSEAELRLEKVFPDWGEKVVSTEFDLWLTAQGPQYRQEIKSTNDADDMLAALVRFQRETVQRQNQPADQAALANQQRAMRAAQAVEPSSSGRAVRTPRGSTAESEFLAAFNRVSGNSG